MSYTRNFVVLKDVSGEFALDFRQCGGRAIIEQRNDRTRILISLQGLKPDEYIGYVFTENTYVNQWLTVSGKGRCDLSWEVSNINAQDVRAICVLKNTVPVLTGYTQPNFNWQKLLVKENNVEAAESVPVKEEVKEEAPQSENKENVKTQLKEIISQFDRELRNIKEINNELPFEDTEFNWQKTDLRQLHNTEKLWKYANNPFVVYGYKRFHHLMIGKNENNYALGVPCVYCKGYTLESQLQGFREFKPVKGQNLDEGQLCYGIIVM